MILGAYVKKHDIHHPLILIQLGMNSGIKN